MSSSSGVEIPDLKQWKSHVGDAYETWKTAKATVTEDKQTLFICGREVMQTWETPLMKELAAVATENGGKILEVGFGLGISASFVQQYEIEEHVIVEANAEVLERAKLFAQTAPHRVTPLFGFWQEVLLTLPSDSFDGILFDPYPISANENTGSVNWAWVFFKEAHRLLKKGGILTYYSDEVEGFGPKHYAALREAGFEEIQFKLVEVQPPENCEYWKSKTMISPRIIK